MKAFEKLGFATYQEYRKSPLWKKIRGRAFKILGNRCRVCKARADVLHHRSYGLKVMRGRNLSMLVPMCHHCHELIEFGLTGKRSIHEANQELARLTSEPKECLDRRFLEIMADPKQ